MWTILDSLARCYAIMRKEVRQLLRDRPTFGMIVGIPLLQITLFGYAINLDVRHIHAGVVDLSASQQSRQWLAAAEASQLVRITHHLHSVEALYDALRRGEINVGIYLPDDFTRRAQGNGSGTDQSAGQIFIDNTSPGLDGVARQLATLPVRDNPANWLNLGGPNPGSGRATAPTFAVHTLYNPERRTAVQIVPALIGVILNLTMVLFTAVAVVRERERGNLEFLITTPVRTWELMLGKIAPYILIGLIQVTLILWVAQLLFDVLIVGSLVDLYLAAALFIAATLALGLVISTFAKTQFQAMQLTVFTFLPSILLSGFMFPFQGMPAIARHIAEFLPLTHFVRLLRGITLRGAELGELMPAIGALAAFFGAFLVLAILRFHKRLD